MHIVTCGPTGLWGARCRIVPAVGRTEQLVNVVNFVSWGSVTCVGWGGRSTTDRSSIADYSFYSFIYSWNGPEICGGCASVAILDEGPSSGLMAFQSNLHLWKQWTGDGRDWAIRRRRPEDNFSAGHLWGSLGEGEFGYSAWWFMIMIKARAIQCFKLS